MPLRYEFDCAQVSTAQLEQLFAATALGGRVGDKIRRAFINSAHVCLVYDGAELIGACRAISDGEYHAFIYDVAVMPAYQAQGIGKQMLEHLLARLPVWRVMLVADAEVQGFYQQHGFACYPDTMARLDWSKLQDPSQADQR